MVCVLSLSNENETWFSNLFLFSNCQGLCMISHAIRYEEGVCMFRLHCTTSRCYNYMLLFKCSYLIFYLESFDKCFDFSHCFRTTKSLSVSLLYPIKFIGRRWKKDSNSHWWWWANPVLGSRLSWAVSFWPICTKTKRFLLSTVSAQNIHKPMAIKQSRYCIVYIEQYA